MKKIVLFLVTLFFGISYASAQQVTINQKNGQKVVYKASDIESIDFSNSEGTLPKILIGAIVLSSAPTDPTDLQTVLTDEVISDAIQKGKDSDGTMYLREKELNEVLNPNFVLDEPDTTLHYGLVMIPNIAEYSQCEVGFIDKMQNVYKDISVITPAKTYLVFNGSTLTYNSVEYNVYGTYSSKIKGLRQWTVNIK